MCEGNFSPNASFEHPVDISVKPLVNRDALRIKVLQRSPMTLFFLDVADVYFVDETMFALSCNSGLRRVCFIRPDVVFLQCSEHRFHASLDLCRVITGTVIRE